MAGEPPTSSRCCWKRLGFSRRPAKQCGTELSAYYRERGLFPEQVERWRPASRDTNEKPVLTMTEQKDVDRRHQQDRRKLKQIKQELLRKEKGTGRSSGTAVGSKKIQAFWGEDAED